MELIVPRNSILEPVSFQGSLDLQLGPVQEVHRAGILPYVLDFYLSNPFVLEVLDDSVLNVEALLGFEQLIEELHHQDVALFDVLQDGFDLGNGYTKLGCHTSRQPTLITKHQYNFDQDHPL